MKARPFAAKVSRTLREAGLRPIPSADHYRRDGIYVSGGALDDTATLTASIVDSTRRESMLFDTAFDILHNAGYTVTMAPRAVNLATVTI